MRPRQRPSVFCDPRVIVVHTPATPARLLAWKKMWALLLSDDEKETSQIAPPAAAPDSSNTPRQEESAHAQAHHALPR